MIATKKKATSAESSSDRPALLLAWYDRHRRGLPWRPPAGERADPYRVWLSEIMLQQTGVKTVGPYFEKFLARWPDVAALGRASQDDVLRMWAGLGYYSRARIIAEPGPHPQHVILRGAAERGDIRPARQKLLEIRPDRFDAGLLQHDFGQPDPIRIGPLARRRPPRQPAAVTVVPGEQQRGTRGRAF